MFSLTARPLLVIAGVLAVLAALGVVWLVYRATGLPPMRRKRRAAFVAGAVALAVLAPAFAVGATGLAVDHGNRIYASWAGLTGTGPAGVAIATGSLVRPGQGSVQVVHVHGGSGVRDNQVLMWLPPGYDPHAAHPYPVVMFLPGQPSTPQGTFRRYAFARTATQLIHDHGVPPFVAVFPTLMIAPPRDTECTNVPGGPRAESWLNTVVPAYVGQHYRVQAPGRNWSVVGWSTGGFCAAKLLTAHPGRYGSATSFGGYFSPLQDHTTGSLFGGQARLYDRNSPMWLYTHHHGLRGSRLLIVAGRQDAESWPSSRRMLQLAGSDPAVSHLVFPTGGHHYENYRGYLARALVWGAKSWRL
jgi:enterochelin esterase-like enzyme